MAWRSRTDSEVKRIMDEGGVDKSHPHWSLCWNLVYASIFGGMGIRYGLKTDFPAVARLIEAQYGWGPFGYSCHVTLCIGESR